MQISQNTRLAMIVAIVTIGFAVADVIWSRNSDISLDPRSWGEFAKVMAMLAVVFLAMRTVERRLSEDRSRPGRLISYSAESIKSLAANAFLLIPIGFASIYFMYLAADTDRPLMDETLAAIDAGIGFNWLSFLELTNSHPAIASALVFAYHSVGPQIPLLIVLLAFTDRVRLTEFMATMAVSSAFTAAAMSLVPAAGAYAYFQPVAADFSNFTAKAGVWHLAELTRLRGDEPVGLLVSQAEGLVTFPSYHTALGIMMTYALRKLPLVAWPVGVLNAMMLVSTLPEGGHHLIDVFAGAAVGALTILCVSMAQSPSAQRDLRVDMEG